MSELAGNGGSRPVPDPTVLTTQQLALAVEGLREKLSDLKELLETRLGGTEEVIDEKFISVNERFGIVERQRVEQKEDTKAAVDAAFSAAKEAVREQTNASERAIAKSETATKEQLNQLSTTFTTAISGIQTSIDDLKERIGKIESIRQGATERKEEGRATISSTTAVVGAVIASIVLILAVYAGLKAVNDSPAKTNVAIVQEI